MSALAVICFALAAILFIVGVAWIPLIDEKKNDANLVTALLFAGLAALCCGIFFGAMAAL